ncbi:MAG: Tm-1-like ATP-binding domain-containing protein [Lachnospiraceae bacterium]|jgi:uncharacterized protein (UPF0261 family)|nr:Tm-1-like ATP-binding domain-containing protein [Lachnospiraceae bacterium]
MGKAVVALAGTLDTKGVEYAFVKEEIEKFGCEVLVIDTSVIGESPLEADIKKEEVAKCGGVELSEFAARVEGDTRVRANKAMSDGLAVILKRLVSEGKIDAALGMGGTGGTDSLSAAFRQLPLEFPKMLVSTMASNNTKPYVGNSDLIMMYSVTDIAGLNSISRVVLSTAAHAAVGMANGYAETKKMTEKSNPLIGITMWGVTTPFVMKMREILEAKGFDVVIFHAVGEGAAMEELIASGVIDGVIDSALPEILNNKLGGIFDAGPNRMCAAAERGIPEMVVPGAVEAFNFGAPETIPEKYNTPERKVILHNPNITSLLATPDEMVWLGEYVADHVMKNPGPKAIYFPTLGLDRYMAEGGPWFGPDYLKPLFETIEKKVKGGDDEIQITAMENHINDEEFAEAVVYKFLELWDQR